MLHLPTLDHGTAELCRLGKVAEPTHVMVHVVRLAVCLLAGVVVLEDRPGRFHKLQDAQGDGILEQQQIARSFAAAEAFSRKIPHKER